MGLAGERVQGSQTKVWSSDNSFLAPILVQCKSISHLVAFIHVEAA